MTTKQLCKSMQCQKEEEQAAEPGQVNIKQMAEKMSEEVAEQEKEKVEEYCKQEK